MRLASMIRILKHPNRVCQVGGKIYPVAIKYDSKFGDAFWNSSRYSIVTYLLMMMTSWAIVVDVWYLPPMEMEKVFRELIGNLT